MNLLGLDTSTAATSVCLLRGDGEVFEVVPQVSAVGGRPAHASELLPAVATVLDDAGLGFDGLDALAVGVGPGAFTGLRIGIASARAIAAARSVGLRPVSSLAALAAGAGPEAGPTLAVTDARRGEVFAALYEGDDALWPAWAAAPEALAERLREAGVTPMAVGDGALRFRGVLEAAGARVAPDESLLHVTRALNVCRLAGHGPALAPDAVVPDYLRRPDAEPAPTIPSS